MPKMKTLSSAKKRFRVSGNGKIRKKKVGMRHLLSKHSAKKKAGRQQPSFLEGRIRDTVREMLVA